MATINGIPVNFGFSGSLGSDKSQGITITNITGALLQTADQTKAADLERVKDGNGNEVVHAFSNIHDEASLEYIVAGTSLAGATANTVLQTPGTILSITACASMPSLIGTAWEVQPGSKISKSNTTAAKITLPIHSFAGITAAAS